MAVRTQLPASPTFGLSPERSRRAIQTGIWSPPKPALDRWARHAEVAAPFFVGSGGVTCGRYTDAVSARRSDLARSAETSPGKSRIRPEDNRRAEARGVPPTGPPARSGNLVARVSTPEPLKIADAALEPASWDELDGWNRDDHASAF